MERTKWTDDLLDQRFGAMDEKLELLFARSGDLREEMRRASRGYATRWATALVAVIGLLGVLVAKL